MKKVIAITGPSGAGKTTLSNYLRKKYKYPFPVHTTTREKRDDDEANFYNYISVNDFLNMVKNAEFLFYSGYKGRYYGILKSDFNNALKSNDGLIINVNYMDLEQIKKFKDDFNIIIIQLTFKDMEKMIRERTSLRNQKEEDTKFRVEVAQRNESLYKDIIDEMVDARCYTDSIPFSEEIKYIEGAIKRFYDNKNH